MKKIKQALEQNNIPTIEEFINKAFVEAYGIGASNQGKLFKALAESFLESNKLHVKAALQAAAKKAKIKERKSTIKASHGSEYHFHTIIDKNSILNAYPPENIK